MKRTILAAGAILALTAATASAAIVSVSSNLSAQGVAASIIGAPASVGAGDNISAGQQGFNETQSVKLTSDLVTDQGVLTAGTRVKSHLIFLDPGALGYASHTDVAWTFTNKVFGTISRTNGSTLAASTADLGLAGTTYDFTTPSIGLEVGQDSFLISGKVVTMGMISGAGGDFIRVLTAVPLPAALPMFLAALGGLALVRRRTA